MSCPLHPHDVSLSFGLWACACHVCSVMFNSLWLHELSPARVFCLWDFPGKNTGVGCHCLLQGIFLTRDQTHISCIVRWILYYWAIKEDFGLWERILKTLLWMSPKQPFPIVLCTHSDVSTVLSFFFRTVMTQFLWLSWEGENHHRVITRHVWATWGVSTV